MEDLILDATLDPYPQPTKMIESPQLWDSWMNPATKQALLPQSCAVDIPAFEPVVSSASEPEVHQNEAVHALPTTVLHEAAWKPMLAL